MAKVVHAEIGDKRFRCHVCDGDVFREREVKLNSTGMEFFNMAWANESANGLICLTCGYVHLFVPGRLTLHRAQG